MGLFTDVKSNVIMRRSYPINVINFDQNDPSVTPHWQEAESIGWCSVYPSCFSRHKIPNQPEPLATGLLSQIRTRKDHKKGRKWKTERVKVPRELEVWAMFPGAVGYRESSVLIATFQLTMRKPTRKSA